MQPGIKRIATKARLDKELCFTSIAHHITRKLLWENLSKIPNNKSAGIDGQQTAAAKDKFAAWSEETLDAIHRRCYKPPPTRRVYIPKPGKSQKRPIALPTVSDKALQKSVSDVLTAIYEEDFLDCSFGGRPNRSAHQAVSKLHNVISSKKVNYVFEADLKNFFGSLNQDWVERFISKRVGDPRIIILIKRWLKAGVMEKGQWHETTEGTVQGGPISVLISNLYLHYVLDLWIEKIVRPRMRGEIYYVRYLDDFVLCFQYQSDAKRFETALVKRLSKFSLSLEASKTRLIEFGKFAKQNAQKRNTKPETMYFLGFTFYCSKNRNGRFKLGVSTENSRQRRSISNMKTLLQAIRHAPLLDQMKRINKTISGHFRYYGIANNWNCIKNFFYLTVKYWRKMLSTRSQNGKVSWDKFNKILKHYPLCKPKIHLSYKELNAMACM